MRYLQAFCFPKIFPKKSFDRIDQVGLTIIDPRRGGRFVPRPPLFIALVIRNPLGLQVVETDAMLSYPIFTPLKKFLLIIGRLPIKKMVSGTTYSSLG